MTNEEAIETLKHEHDYAQLLSYVNEAIKLAISALEKQIPMKPNNINIEKYKVSYECPKCRTEHINEWCETKWKLPFCSICGQSLDWNDTVDICEIGWL